MSPTAEFEPSPALISITYISSCRIPNVDVVSTIQALVSKSKASNAVHGITGALLFTGTSFVQMLEGSPLVIDPLMVRIVVDWRHAGVTVIERREVATRAFPEWSMAYSGSSVFIEREVGRSLDGARRGAPTDINRLLRLVREFGAPSWPRSMP